MSLSSHAATPAPKFRVAICGAGPGGLALAKTILRYTPPSDSIAIDIYEAAPEIGTVGAGVGIWPRTTALLDAMGLLDRLSGEVNSMGTGLSEGWGFTFRVSEQPEEGMNYHVLKAPAASSDPVMVHRSALLKTLQDGLLSDASKCTVEIRTNARLTSYTSSSPTSPITLHFTDRSSAQTDVLIGADGIRSVVRSTMFSVPSLDDTSLKEKVEPRWAGVVAYRSLINKEDLKKVWTPEQLRGSGMRAMVYCGETKHITAYPIADGTIINFVGFYNVAGAYDSRTPYPGKWMREASAEEIKECYKDFEEEVRGLVSCIRTATAWGIHILGDVPNYAIDRAAILGDAAHAMETNFGAGAGQAMEDAYYLGRLLAHPPTTLDRENGTTDVATALKIYDQARRDFSNTIVHNAHAAGQTYDFDNATGLPPDFLAKLRRGDDKETKEWLENWSGNLNRLWAFQWDAEAVEKDWVTTEELLKKAAGAQ